jgi:outer membrane protein OmpA-like peptidoglycan-associated protein
MTIRLISSGTGTDDARLLSCSGVDESVGSLQETSKGDRQMNKVGIRLVLVTLTVAWLSGCAAWQEQSRTTKGAVYGTATGAAAGSAIGAIVGGGQGAWKGAAIGAVVGGLTGGVVGHYMDNQAKEMQAVLAEQDRLRREQDHLQVAMASDVMFESGSDYLQPGGRDKLSQFAGVLNRYPRTNIEVVGHTDSRGSEESNYELSRKRAVAVADELVRDGVSNSRIAVRGEGESRPVATNDTPEGRAMNRRVEINVAPDEGLRREEAAGQEPR